MHPINRNGTNNSKHRKGFVRKCQQQSTDNSKNWIIIYIKIIITHMNELKWNLNETKLKLPLTFRPLIDYYYLSHREWIWEYFLPLEVGSVVRFHTYLQTPPHTHTHTQTWNMQTCWEKWISTICVHLLLPSLYIRSVSSRPWSFHIRSNLSEMRETEMISARHALVILYQHLKSKPFLCNLFSHRLLCHVDLRNVLN